MSEALERAREAKRASAALAAASAEKRSAAIVACADALLAACEDILAANARDLARAREAGMSAPLQDRLMLDEARIAGIADAMREIASQADPLSRVVSGSTLASGIRIEQVRVPMGVVAVIYEARPNVTADAAALCLRSGNAAVLRGGSAAAESCAAIVHALRSGLEEAGLPADAVAYVSSTSRDETLELMRATGFVDVLIPRGGAGLIRSCVENAQVPVIETGIGNCHTYLSATADPEMATAILVNAKTQRPGVCNACESLLVDESAAAMLLPVVLPPLAERGVEFVGDPLAMSIAHEHGIPMGEASDQDWGTEYLDLKLSVKCVSGTDEAIAHINRYGTGHSECIVTSSYADAEAFLAGVDAAAVYVNASTRFTDGGVFGLGGEIGISTQKLHVRGPFGADALTTTKYLVRGDGQIR